MAISAKASHWCRRKRCQPSTVCCCFSSCWQSSCTLAGAIMSWNCFCRPAARLCSRLILGFYFEVRHFWTKEGEMRVGVPFSLRGEERRHDYAIPASHLIDTLPDCPGDSARTLCQSDCPPCGGSPQYRLSRAQKGWIVAGVRCPDGAEARPGACQVFGGQPSTKPAALWREVRLFHRMRFVAGLRV
jgi:hypothetical protein